MVFLSTIWFLIFAQNYYHNYPLSLRFANMPFFLALTRFLEIFASSFLQIIWLCAILLVSFRLGEKFLNLARLKKDGLENMLFSLALGLSFLIYFVFVLGSLGFLYSFYFKIVFAVISFIALWKFKPPNIRKEINFSSLKLRWKIALFMLCFFIILNFIMAFTPETFYDALVYQLSVPNFYILKHKISPMPFLMHSNFPMNVNMIYLLSLLLSNETLAKLIHFSLTLISAFVIYAAVKKHYSHKSAIVSSVIYYSTPILLINSWRCGNDAALGFFFSLAIFSYLNWRKEQINSHLWLTAVFLGVTLGSKYTAIFPVFGLAAVIFFNIFQEKRNIIKRLFIVTSIVFILFLPWLVKNYLFTGNPFCPFLSKVFGGQNLYNFGHSGVISDAPLNLFHFNLKAFLSSFWSLTLNASQPQNFIGPIFLFMFPLLLLVKKFERNIVFLLAAFILNYIAWYMGTPIFRFMMPAFALLAVSLGYNLTTICEKSILFFSFFLFFVLSNLISLLNISATIKLKPYLGQKIPKDEFLSTSHPSYPNPPYKVLLWINKNLPLKTRILFSAENKSYYLKRDYITYSAESNLQPLIEFLKKSENAKEFYSILKEKGITHILINYREAIRLQPSYKTFYWNEKERKIFDEFWKKHARKEYFAEGTYLYSISEKIEKPEVNILEELEKHGWKRQNLLKIFADNNMKKSLIDEYEDLLRYGMDVRKQISFLKSQITD